MLSGNDQGPGNHDESNWTPHTTGWTANELKVMEIILRIMEIDPPLSRVETVLEKGLDMVRRLREGRDVTDEEDQDQ